jgi:ribulose-phosphate 3-epimerase
MNPRISASILNADFSCLKKQIEEAEKAGIEWIHLDVMDGHFVPNISVGPFIVETCRKITKLPLDIHLMIENPDKYIEQFAMAGSTYISVHIENNPNIHRTLQRIRELNCKPSIVINPGTPVSCINSVFEMVEMILVMTVNPGFGGQSFIANQVDKIKEIKKMINSLEKKPLIEVDGGITAKTLPLVYNAGADIFVIGSAIFSNSLGIAKSIAEINGSIK